MARLLLTAWILWQATTIHSFQFFPSATTGLTKALPASSLGGEPLLHSRLLRMRADLSSIKSVATSPVTNLDAHIPIDLSYPGLRQVNKDAAFLTRNLTLSILVQIHSSPDIYIIDEFLTPDECDSIMKTALNSNMQLSPGASSSVHIQSHERSLHILIHSFVESFTLRGGGSRLRWLDRGCGHLEPAAAHRRTPHRQQHAQRWPRPHRGRFARSVQDAP